MKDIYGDINENEIKREAIGILERSKWLVERVELVYKEIEAFGIEYSDDIVKELGWEEKEEMIRRSEELGKRLEKRMEELRVMEEEYEELRIRVKEIYGYDVMGKHDLLIDITDEEENDIGSYGKGGGDWWRRER